MAIPIVQGQEANSAYEYKGFLIHSKPIELERERKDGSKWKVRIFISLKHSPGQAIGKCFEKGFYYPTRQQADRYGLEYGRWIIDGKVPGKSLA